MLFRGPSVFTQMETFSQLSLALQAVLVKINHYTKKKTYRTFYDVLKVKIQC